MFSRYLQNHRLPNELLPTLTGLAVYCCVMLPAKSGEPAESYCGEKKVSWGLWRLGEGGGVRERYETNPTSNDISKTKD